MYDSLGQRFCLAPRRAAGVQFPLAKTYSVFCELLMTAYGRCPLSRNSRCTVVAAAEKEGGREAVPSRFKRVLDKATGKHYYYDRETKETFWTLTEGSAGIPLSIAPEDPRKRRKSESFSHPLSIYRVCPLTTVVVRLVRLCLQV